MELCANLRPFYMTFSSFRVGPGPIWDRQGNAVQFLEQNCGYIYIPPAHTLSLNLCSWAAWNKTPLWNVKRGLVLLLGGLSWGEVHPMAYPTTGPFRFFRNAERLSLFISYTQNSFVWKHGVRHVTDPLEISHTHTERNVSVWESHVTTEAKYSWM